MSIELGFFGLPGPTKPMGRARPWLGEDRAGPACVGLYFVKRCLDVYVIINANIISSALEYKRQPEHH